MINNANHNPNKIFSCQSSVESIHTNKDYYNNELQKVFNLELTFSKLKLSMINNTNIKLEDTELYVDLLTYYLVSYKQLFNSLDTSNQNIIFNNQRLLDDFYHFIFTQVLLGKIKIPKKFKQKFMYLLTDFQSRNIKKIDISSLPNKHINMFGISTYTETQIMNKLFNKSNTDTLTQKNVDNLNKIKTAYSMVRWMFQDQQRKDIITNTNRQKNSFTHMEGVMNIVLSGDYGDVTLDRLLIALLHDTREDIAGFTKKNIEDIFGSNVAKCVEFLTKRPWQEYVNQVCDTTDQTKIIEGAKILRNNEYFGNISKNSFPTDALIVKICDRIHNMTYMDNIPLQDKLRKIKETEKFFLEQNIWTKERLDKAFLKLKYIIDNLKQTDTI